MLGVLDRCSVKLQRYAKLWDEVSFFQLVDDRRFDPNSIVKEKGALAFALATDTSNLSPLSKNMAAWKVAHSSTCVGRQRDCVECRVGSRR